ncbi:MAG: mechanosensitive ion channel [bacterium]|nr:mechanosensitive ion channel [bacterium]
MDDIIFELLARFAGFIIFATAIVIALDLLGVNGMPFIAGAGVAGVAIGFAAKDTLWWSEILANPRSISNCGCGLQTPANEWIQSRL